MNADAPDGVGELSDGPRPVFVDAVTPRWHGDALDLDHITTALWCVDQRRPDRN